ncbi:phosphoribosyl-AMP cyclohydrolase [Colwellia psychrerythraea]|uniref:Phosphoribosyl-AMP cyclohydrolase n=1 Tax=Colwellia psychrerythraea TaxID=28229 RepID=A0A099KFR0_COLPS|nr:phosphoribosyl-AMP cyclohydrolase [Colwellia psychrerythraea]KGJ89594.1 Phosphoribosyl-AMP cyclohydrolase [Colwellia psychrerythraea]
MLNDFYLSLETLIEDDFVALPDCIEHLAFNDQGLIPVIAQCQITKDVLMHAWMNRAALDKTITTGRMTYWSRSRNDFWVKGETSGHTQQLVTMRFDCDGDTILCLVTQSGAACHTGRSNCFYLQVDSDCHTVQLHTPPQNMEIADD